MVSSCRIRTLLALSLALAALPARASAAAGEGRPNVVILLADDLGYGDLACYGGSIPAPHIEKLAAQGALFTQAYVAAPVCTPSRAGLFRGLHPARVGVQANTGENKLARQKERGLAPEVVTFAERLHDLGYHTGLVGKWHLGLGEGMTPIDQGFDEFFGFLGSAHGYLPKPTEVRMMRGEKKEEGQEAEYLTDALAREAEGFVSRNKSQPFALTVCFNAPHSPFEASGPYLQRFPQLSGQARTYSAMIAALDDAIGRIVARLEQEGLAGNTLVFFSSDNGAPLDEGPGSNGKFRQGKGFLFEGGSRVPLVVRWPGHGTAGARIDAAVSLLDVTATMLEAAGAPGEMMAELDGVDLAPALAGAALPERALFWKLGPSAAIRRGSWKLVTSQGSRWLFDLEKDPTESTDLIEQEAQVVASLASELAAWTGALPKPLWRNAELEAPVKVLGKPYWVEF